jgi:hypothetical protein
MRGGSRCNWTVRGAETPTFYGEVHTANRCGFRFGYNLPDLRLLLACCHLTLPAVSFVGLFEVLAPAALWHAGLGCPSVVSCQIAPSC